MKILEIVGISNYEHVRHSILIRGLGRLILGSHGSRAKSPYERELWYVSKKVEALGHCT